VLCRESACRLELFIIDLMKTYYVISALVLSLSAGAQELPALQVSEPIKSIYKLDIFRAGQGTIQIAREGRLNDRNTWQLALMGTYASTRGLAKPYLRAQEFSYYDTETQSTYNLYDVEARGAGINFQLKRYLGNEPELFKGFYSGPEIFVRFLNLHSPVFVPGSGEQKEIVRDLYLGFAGYMFGYQHIIREVISLDIYLGGGLFYSQYGDQSSPTRYRNNFQVDYTGIFFNTGIYIGVVK
jgi:hypothetical protein